MIELDFTKIRIHNSSQHGGFEELICQLAHLSPPANSDYFIRKEGSGGDAGVECYWKLKDGPEHAWQAKYFLQPLGKIQWDQINKSVKTALKKHPKITKYYICLPRDWTDSRKTTQKRETVKSAWDHWQEHKKEWEKNARDLGMNVDFFYWCKHEITSMLLQADPRFAGRAYYWFTTPVLTIDNFTRVAERSQNSLGERYTPEFHVDLPIVKVFDGLARTQVWWNELEKLINTCKESVSGAEVAITTIAKLPGNENLMSLTQEIDELFTCLSTDIIKRSFINQIELYKNRIEKLTETLSSISDQLYRINISKSENSNQQYQSELFIRFESEIRSLLMYLNSNICNAASQRCVLLEGEAGIGKSHLLCDITIKRLKDGLPTLFVLGQHYLAGNPLVTFKDALDLNDVSHQVLLGSLDAAGETSKSNTLIIIDAINEGTHRDDWANHLSAFLHEVIKFPYLSVVISCRSTYVDYLIQKELTNDPLVIVAHQGFRGFEHRAASKYLSAQGISKPSAPITAPEFTNPLFLKTCCKALKNNGQSSFPKGLQGITRLFNFYIDSLDHIVANKKRFRPGEQIAKEVLESFANALYPNYLSGLPIKNARQLVNSHDQNSQYGDSLFDILIQEGVLSEDRVFDQHTEKKTCIVRFTYERFSDHFIAQNITNQITEESLESIFKIGGSLESLFRKNKYYSTLGILSALSILIAEKWNREIIDLIPESAANDDWLFNAIFTDTLMWRSRESFNARTLELLNQVSNQGYSSPSLDILLALATEPSHPWNAELLHKILAKMQMPQRDRFWSAHVAINDYNEEDNGQESILRSLIDWAHSGCIVDVEPEQIRLCAIVLMWVTSSPNRKVRDQATKSIVRLLSIHPHFLENILTLFSDIDDLYILERLYAVAYGVLTNINDEDIIKAISIFVFNKVFASNDPPPHLLLRDYCNGIMELAYQKKLTDSMIEPSSFRPPFKSHWHLHDPANDELEKLIDDTGSSSIKSSIMGIIGDFGNYTMGCVHNWSPTLIKDGTAKTAYELQREFAQTLPDELKKIYLAFLDIKRKIDNQEFDINQFIESIKNSDALNATPKEESKLSEDEILKNKIESALTLDEKEYFNWLMGIGKSDSISCFSKMKAQRWVCKRAIELGWTNQLFEEFESYHCRIYHRSTEHKIDRIGKKYQWIALYEFLAHLSDNFCFIGSGYNKATDFKYLGPWQIFMRDIDPTYWERKVKDNEWYSDNKEYWWQPFVYPFTGESLEELQKWLWDESIIPPFEELLQVRENATGPSWCVLKSFAMWKKEPTKDRDGVPYHQDAWYRINSCIVPKDQVIEIEKALEGTNLCEPNILQPGITGQGCLKEYPWHPIFNDFNEWDTYFGGSIELKTPRLIPVSLYEWESRGSSSSISIYLPGKVLVNSLALSHDLNNLGQWKDNNNQLIFFDPSAQSSGPSVALVRSDKFHKWLDSNDLQLIWLIGGEKQLFKHADPTLYLRLAYSGIYKLTNDGINKKIWFIKEPSYE